MELTFTEGYPYSHQYHIIWCTKYEEKGSEKWSGYDCKALLYSLDGEYRLMILAMEVMPEGEETGEIVRPPRDLERLQACHRGLAEKEESGT